MRIILILISSLIPCASAFAVVDIRLLTSTRFRNCTFSCSCTWTWTWACIYLVAFPPLLMAKTIMVIFNFVPVAAAIVWTVVSLIGTSAGILVTFGSCSSATDKQSVSVDCFSHHPIGTNAAKRVWYRTIIFFMQLWMPSKEDCTSCFVGIKLPEPLHENSKFMQWITCSFSNNSLDCYLSAMPSNQSSSYECYFVTGDPRIGQLLAQGWCTQHDWPLWCRNCMSQTLAVCLTPAMQLIAF